MRMTFRGLRTPFSLLLPGALSVLYPISPIHMASGGVSEAADASTVDAASTDKAPTLVMLPIIELDGGAYVSLCAAAEMLGGRLVASPVKKKLTLVVGGHELRFTRHSNIVVANDVAYRMPRPARLNGCLHAPAEALLERLTGAVSGVRIALAPAAAADASDSEPPALPEFEQPSADVARWGLDTIVIDPGHGGRDPGAVGRTGTKEKTITLEVARKLKPMLEKRLGVRVVLTRERDRFVALSERSRIAVRAGGKLFVSLHCNAHDNRKADGLEVYFLSEARTAEAADVARRENASLKFESEDLSAEDLNELQRIEGGLLTSQYLVESQDLAATVRSELRNLGELDDRGVKQANFYVMRGTMGSMPSILVEMGFISNRKEEKRLRSGAFQKKLSEAIFAGIKGFKQRYERAFQTGR